MGKSKSLTQIFSSLSQMIRRLSPEIRKYRAPILGAFAAMAANIGFKVLEPWPLKFVLDYVILADSNKRALNNFFNVTLNPETLLLLAVLAVIVFASLSGWAAYRSVIGFSSVGNHVMNKVRSDLFSQVQCLSMSFHAKSPKGDLLVLAIGDIRLLREALVTAALPLVSSILMLLVMLTVMLCLNWKLALVALAITPVFLFSIMMVTQKIHTISLKQRRSQGDLATTMAESIEAIKTVQALSLEEKFSKTFSRTSDENLDQEVKSRRLTAGLALTTDMFIALATALVLGYGALLAMANELSPGDLIVFLSYLKSAFKPLRKVTRTTGRLAKAAVASERIMAVLDLTPEVRDLPDAVPAPPFQGTVRFESVDFFYEPGLATLKEVSFEISPGQQVALVAPSGSGKSTLANLIMRFYDPSRGQVLIDGKDIRSYTLSSLRAQVSVVLQDTLLFTTSVRENIAYGKADATLEEIEVAARAASAHEFIMALPKGYETILSEGGATLSSGQRQRISIARAVIRKSPILILDEPTTGLDRENAREVMKILTNISKGCTTLLITHDLDFISQVDTILYLEDGNIRESGTRGDTAHPMTSDPYTISEEE